MAPYLRCKTPPKDLFYTQAKSHLRTPSRCAVLGVVYYCQQKKLPVNASDLSETFGISERSIKRVLEHNQCRSLHNIEDSGPDPRGTHPVFTKEELSKCGDYLDNCSFEEATEPWRTALARRRVWSILSAKSYRAVAIFGGSFRSTSVIALMKFSCILRALCTVCSRTMFFEFVLK
jgi:hypothetical protein